MDRLRCVSFQPSWGVGSRRSVCKISSPRCGRLSPRLYPLHTKGFQGVAPAIQICSDYRTNKQSFAQMAFAMHTQRDRGRIFNQCRSLRPSPGTTHPNGPTPNRDRDASHAVCSFLKVQEGDAGNPDKSRVSPGNPR